jgi:hypothetical protein
MIQEILKEFESLINTNENLLEKKIYENLKQKILKLYYKKRIKGNLINLKLLIVIILKKQM